MKESYIKRTKRTENFTVLGNQIFESGFSPESLGILCYILHLPEDWVLHKTQLMKTFNIGRDKMDRIFREIKSKGYLADVLNVKLNGKYNGVHYVVYDEPLTALPPTEKPCPEKPCPEKPTTTKNVLYKELSLQRTNNTKKKSAKKADNKVLDNLDFLFD